MSDRQTCDRCGEEFEREQLIVLQNGTGVMDEACYREMQAEVDARTGPGEPPANPEPVTKTDSEIEAEFREVGREEVLDQLRTVHRYLSSRGEDESIRMAGTLERAIDTVESLVAVDQQDEDLERPAATL